MDAFLMTKQPFIEPHLLQKTLKYAHIVDCTNKLHCGEMWRQFQQPHLTMLGVSCLWCSLFEDKTPKGSIYMSISAFTISEIQTLI